MSAAAVPGPSDREAELAAVVAMVEAVLGHPDRRGELVPYLADQHPVYRDRGADEVVRMRAFVMQAFERVGLPEEALSFVLEDLESSLEPHAVAAAARAIRGWQAPSTPVVALLERAIQNVRRMDEHVSFAGVDAVGDPDSDRTATAEIEATLAWFGARGLTSAAGDDDEDGASDGACCGLGGRANAVRRFGGAERSGPRALDALELQDHEGRASTFGEMFVGKPSVVAFFYTRCENPRKCSLTIAKLARVQTLLAQAGAAGAVRIAAVTYDPLFDSPERLRAYGEARGMRLDDDNRLLRTSRDHESLRTHFALGVNFVQSIVNRHRVELYVLDARGAVATAFTRLEWSEARVVDEVLALVGKDGASGAGAGSKRGAMARGVARSLPALALALLPKCPACWVAYMSAFGIAGLDREADWVLPILCILVVANVAAAWNRARRTRRRLPFGLSLAGAVALLPLGTVLGIRELLPVGVALTAAGALFGPGLLRFGRRQWEGPTSDRSSRAARMSGARS